MIVKVEKKDKIIVIDSARITHYEIIATWPSGKPTLIGVKEDAKSVTLCERRTVEECLEELNAIFRGEAIERENKIKDLIVSIHYQPEEKQQEKNVPTPKQAQAK